MLLVEVVYPSCRISAPWGKCLLFHALAAIFKGFRSIHLKTLVECICHHGNSMVGIHSPGIARHLGEGGHPAGTHMSCHTKVAVYNVLLLCRFNQGTQGMGSTVGVPNPVVRIERPATMYVAIERREITTGLAQTNGTLESAVETGIEYGLLILGATLDLYVRQGLVPDLASCSRYGLYVKTLALLTFKVLLCPLGTYQGYPIPHADPFSPLGKANHTGPPRVLIEGGAFGTSSRHACLAILQRTYP